MKSLRSVLILSSFLLVVCVGCSHKTDAKSALEEAASVLDNAPAQPAPAVAQAPAEPAPPDSSPPTIPQPAALADSGAQPASPGAQMRQALASYKSGELEDAVTRLQKLRTTATLTPQQRMALQDSVAAVMTEVYELAAKGDTRAIAAVKQYEDMQTARH